MDFLGPYHPLIIHTPIALIIVSLLFEIVGLATDAQWWRKASFAMLIVGVLGAGAAVLSGEPASDQAEEVQGIPEATVEHHEDVGKMALWIGVGAVVFRAASAGLGTAGGLRIAVAALAFLLHLAAAVTVGVAGYRGGQLVFESGAAVRVNGQLLHHGAAAGQKAATPGVAEVAPGGEAREAGEEHERR